MKNNLKNILMLSAFILIMSTVDVMAVCSPTDCTRYGYTKTEADCSGMDTIRCPFDVTKVMCKKAPTICKVGDIYYNDETCSTDVVSGKTPIGVVGYIENGGASGLILALDETQKTWSSEYYDLPCLENTYSLQFGKGKENTACIVQTKNSRGASYDAGMYCANYTSGGIKGWFLPSAGEGNHIIYKAQNDINTALSKLGKVKLNTSGTGYWTSTEFPSYADNGVYHVDLSSGASANDESKKRSKYVRCVREF